MPENSRSTPRIGDLDRSIVAGLAVSGRATWSQLGRAVGVGETTVARRAQRLFDEGLVTIVGLPDPLACGYGQPVLVHLRCAPGAVRTVAAELARRADARLVVVIAGPSDIIVELISTNRDHLASVLIDEIQTMPGVVETSTETVLKTFKLTFDWARDLLGDGVTALEPTANEPGKAATRLDDTDLALVAELTADGRRSYAELAAVLGISESRAARRVSRLVDAGCLSFAAVVDPALLGYTVEAFFRLQVDISRLEAIAATLCERTGVRYVSATTGASDLVCEVVLPDTDALYRFVTDTLSSVPGLKSVETSLELQTLKRAFRARPVLSADLRAAAKPELWTKQPELSTKE